MEVIDRLNTAAQSGEEKRSKKLEDVGQALTGKGKLQAPEWVVERFGRKRLGEIAYELWEAGGAFRDLLRDYCVEDTDLCRAIEDETGFVELFHVMTSACGIFADTAGLNPTHQVDGYLMRLGSVRGERFPTRTFREAGEKFRGAYVMRPKSLDPKWRKERGMTDGILEQVHVFDFKSLYPSIIQTLNMSAETKRPGPVNGPIPEGMCRAPGTGICFDVGEEVLLVFAITELLRLRKQYTEAKNKCPPGTDEWHAWDRLSTAMKVMANAFFGVVSSFYSRHYDRQIGESITQTAQWLIRRTLEEAEAKTDWASCKRAEGVYSDTDSGFLIGPSIDEFQAFVAWANKDLFPRLMAEIGCAKSTIKLNFEKTHELIVFTAGKRYIARYAQADGKPATEESKPEIKGLEWRRGAIVRIGARFNAFGPEPVDHQRAMHDRATFPLARMPVVAESRMNRQRH
jgi:DNA polymerase elongation subunit (family B)